MSILSPAPSGVPPISSDTPTPVSVVLNQRQVMFVLPHQRRRPVWTSAGLISNIAHKRLELHAVGDPWRLVGVIQNKALLASIVSADDHYIGWLRNPLEPLEQDVQVEKDLCCVKVAMRFDRLL